MIKFNSVFQLILRKLNDSIKHGTKLISKAVKLNSTTTNLRLILCHQYRNINH